jgi:hypothetical protein
MNSTNIPKYILVIDNKEFTEHGGSVPGWLSKTGKSLLHELNDIYGQVDIKV